MGLRTRGLLLALICVLTLKLVTIETVFIVSEAPSQKQPGAKHQSEAAEADETVAVRAEQLVRVEGGGKGECGVEYSSVRCADYGDDTFIGGSGVYGFTLINRSCVYSDLVYKPGLGFVFYAKSKSDGVLPPVSLASRPFDLPIMHFKRVKLKKKINPSMEWRPIVVVGRIPCSVERSDTVLAYYSPIVAPWNFAHTLLCDLFGLYWAMWEHGMSTVRDAQVVAYSSFYKKRFPLPNKNKAFDMFSSKPPVYDVALPHRVYKTVIAGTGTKSWSWVTSHYSASGNHKLWQDFRAHIVRVTGAQPTPKKDSNEVRLRLCVKKDKRGVANYDEVADMLTSYKLPGTSRSLTIQLDELVKKSARGQVEAMLDTDIYMCNEGTLATTFFLMAPGSVFFSIPLVYHTPHLHQKYVGRREREWWRLPDILRPDPRKNTGGNIDWFPQAIDYVKTIWYYTIPMNETKIQLPLRNLRNYMPDFNIVIQKPRLYPLLDDAVKWVHGKHAVVDRPNYSINADICRQLLEKTPSLATSFNSARCYFGMSWLCEFYANTDYKWRFMHGKWQLSKSRCGSDASNPQKMGIRDPRDALPLKDFMFYTKEELEKAYTTTDMGKFNVSSDDVLSQLKEGVLEAVADGGSGDDKAEKRGEDPQDGGGDE